MRFQAVHRSLVAPTARNPGRVVQGPAGLDRTGQNIGPRKTVGVSPTTGWETRAWPSPEDDRPGATVGERVGRLPYKLTRDRSNDVWRWHGIGHDPAFAAATSAHPRMLYMLETLLGGPVKRPRRNRGIYAVFPLDPEVSASQLGPHMDQSMTEMSAVTYLEDVPPNSGGFTIYPTSPQLLYPTSAQALNWVATDRSSEVLDQIKSEIQPLEFTGRTRDDTIFCHGWIVHSAGIHETDRIRFAAIQDFNKVRQRSHMRWTAAGKNGGPRVNCDMDGVFRFCRRVPTTTPPTATGKSPTSGSWTPMNSS